MLFIKLNCSQSEFTTELSFAWWSIQGVATLCPYVLTKTTYTLNIIPILDGFVCNLYNRACFVRQFKKGLATQCFDWSYTETTHRNIGLLPLILFALQKRALNRSKCNHSDVTGWASTPVHNWPRHSKAMLLKHIF